MTATTNSIRLLLLAFLLAFTVAAQAEHADSDATYRLGNGDKIRITVFGEEDLSGTFVVDGKGSIAMPLIGEVQVGNLALREVENAIVQKLLNGFLKKPQVSIEVLNYRPFYILGEVKKPGSYPYVEGMSILKAVALAGGFTYRANKDVMIVTRASDPQEQEQEADPNTRIFPGDTIRIKERFF